MQIILEQKDLLSLLGKALGYTLEEGDVEVVADPFEVRIRSVRLNDLAQTIEPPASSVPATPPPSAPLPHIGVVDEYEEEHSSSMEGLIQQNDRMKNTEGDAPIVRDNLGPTESYGAPPFDTEEKLR